MKQKNNQKKYNLSTYTNSKGYGNIDNVPKEYINTPILNNYKCSN